MHFAVTKIQPPRPRPGWIARPRLESRFAAAIGTHRLVLVSAPAGFGKTALLARQVHALAGDTALAWIAADSGDDLHRLLECLVAALEPYDLPWRLAPEAVAVQAADGSPALRRTAAAALLNTLDAADAARGLIVLDDGHRVDDADVWRFLDLLLERLSPRWTLAISTRHDPPLALARLRAAGELAEFRQTDLAFDRDEVLALAAADGVEPAAADRLLARTHGWAAGLQLVLGSARSPDDARPALIGPAARRHLFDYFAQEVLAGLPPPLQQFVLHSSVLPELSPPLCQAVTGRADARAVLEALYARQLFLSALDDVAPVLRFHDLFRDFLRAELERRQPGLAPALHARAAAAEASAERAIPHWLAAGRWAEALACLRQMADGLLAVGGTHRLERWLEQLPPDWRAADADVALLRGLCAWSRWDWLRAQSEFERSHAAFARQGQERDRIVALGMLAACHNALGDLPRASEALQAVAAAQLTPALQVPFDSLRAWHGLARGDHASLLDALGAMADNAALAPEVRYPNIVDMSYGHFVGLPGTRGPMQRLQRLCRAHPPGEVQVPALDAWLAFWHGTPAAAREALQTLLQLQRHLPGDVMLGIAALHLRTLHLAVQGQAAEALASVAQVQHLMTAGYANGWRRTYLHVQARILWRGEDADGLAALLPELTRPRTAREWPVLDTGAALVQGQHALLRGELATARQHLEHAVALQAGGWLPAFMGDARFALAACCWAQGDVDAAATALGPVVAESVQDEGLGLLLEPPGRLKPLWQATEARLPCPAAAQARLRQRLADWTAAAPPQAQPPDDPLSEREREVLALLADGQSNKLIARALDLSLHTVKRHVANILTKLAVDSRTQAAAYWHRR